MRYLGRIIKANLSNGFFFEGRVIEEDGDIIIIIDRKNKNVQLNIKQIQSLEVVD